ncbi:response regulator transcription factor [Ramlibacter humi]|uniref:Response regulator transcription factor n=1 Tax=Ramlibacter humi TaxID=2530451 RepID=A0A4Z0CBB3_9BURK|nr:response regulator transcription factor [Ramlibacter humi]TFZ07708.1 response regulator transcription factor [Ramlibacter humi]
MRRRGSKKAGARRRGAHTLEASGLQAGRHSRKFCTRAIPKTRKPLIGAARSSMIAKEGPAHARPAVTRRRKRFGRAQTTIRETCMRPEERAPIRVVLADDHELVRSGINALLTSISGVQVIAEAGSGEELLGILQTVRPDIVITDIGMPGIDGYAVCERIRAESPEVRVVVLSADDSIEAVKKAVASGACGYIRKDAAKFELELAVRGVMQTGSYFTSRVTQDLLRPSAPQLHQLLTERQVEVLTMLASGKSAKEIGFELGLSSKTVDAHRANIMERLNLRDNASLIRYAIRNRLVKD